MLAPLIISGLKVQKDTQGGEARVDHILGGLTRRR
jgi:hypothetical protein